MKFLFDLGPTMQGAWLDQLRDRWRSVWDVLLGRAYAAYSVPDIMDEMRLRIALASIANSTCCEGCQQAAKVARAALDPKPVGDTLGE